MLRSVRFYLFTLTLLSVGAYGLWQIIGNSDRYNKAGIRIESNATSDLKQDDVITDSSYSQLISKLSDKHRQNADARTLSAHLDNIQSLLNEGRYRLATEYINENYSGISSDDLVQIKQLYATKELLLNQQGDISQLHTIYESKTAVFDDLESWNQLAQVSIKRSNWSSAFSALLKASLLETDGNSLEKMLSALIRVTANLRAQHEQYGDNLASHRLYETLYRSHPSFNRFQLELAYSYLRLKDQANARTLLTQLQYDIELGSISRDLLAKLGSSERSTEIDNAISSKQSLGVMIPIQRLGTNMLVNLKVNQKPITLLLDTGASITALDTKTVSRLGLQANGQSIQISTANGIRDANLYTIRDVQLGSFVIKNLTIAGIDLGNDRHFSGLLGTDLLNSVSKEYAYSIDNAQNALIFTPTNEL